MKRKGFNLEKKDRGEPDFTDDGSVPNLVELRRFTDKVRADSERMKRYARMSRGGKISGTDRRLLWTAADVMEKMAQKVKAILHGD